jgi:hypothetical protein
MNQPFENNLNNFNIITNFLISAEMMNKINKLIMKDHKKQQKENNKKNKLLLKLIKEHKQLNKPKIIIEI